jgi:cation:H+ antiporter
MIDFVILGLIFAGSLALLAKASHLTITSIEELVEITGLSEASAGFVILAVMTSIPEMFVAIFSVLQEAPGISVGDILGSNMFNIGMVIGVMAIIGPLEKVRSDFLIEVVDILFLSSIIPILLAVPFLSTSFQNMSPFVGTLLISISFSAFTEWH